MAGSPVNIEKLQLDMGATSGPAYSGMGTVNFGNLGAVKSSPSLLFAVVVVVAFYLIKRFV